MKNSTNLGQNSLNSNANFWAKLKALFALPKWAKIFFAVLSVVAVAGLLGAFALQSWAKDNIQHGEFVLNGVDKSWQERLESGFAYDSRLYFEKADFLLRSKVIAYIDIRDISWVSPIDKNAIIELKSQNRHIKFSTSQNLSEFNGQKLGVVEYKMDFSPLFKTILWYYVLIICLCLFVSFAYRLLYLTENGKISPFLNQISLPQALWQGYKAINPLYRHTFWIVFIALNLVFGFHTVQFLWGNHDWDLVFGQIYQSWFISVGRYTHDALSLTLQMGMILPFVNNILAFASLALGVVWFCTYLNIQQKLWIWALIGLVIALSPLTFERLYFTHQTAGFFIAFAFCMVGFVLAQKANKYDKSRRRKSYILGILSILCFHWALATYQPFLDTIGVVFFGGMIALIIDEKGNLKTAFYKTRFVIISVAFGMISYKIVFELLKKLGIVIEGYNNRLVAMSEFFERLAIGIKSAFKNLFAYDSLSMPLSMTILFIVFIPILLALLGLLNLKLKAKIAIFILLLGSIISSQTSNILSNGITRTDINSTGLLIVRALILALVFKLSIEFVRIKNSVQNILFIVCVIIIWLCIIINLQAQRAQKHAFDAEFRLFNQIVDRFSQNDNFSYDKKYCGVMFGHLEPMRLRYFGKKDIKFATNPYSQNTFDNYNILTNYTLTQGWLAVDWNAGYIFKWLMPKNVFSECDFYLFSNIQNKTNDKFLSLLARLDKAGVLDTLQPFPHKNSVVVFEDIIVFVASKINLDEIKTAVKAFESTLPNGLQNSQSISKDNK